MAIPYRVDPTVGCSRLYWSKNYQEGVPFSNGSNYSNPKVDALLEGAAVEIDPAKRKAMFFEFQKIVAQEIRTSRSIRRST